jgi:4'-phosphopantetheinyl transferase
MKNLLKNEILIVFMKLDSSPRYQFSTDDRSILSDSEKDAVSKFRFESDRYRFQLTRLFTRRILGRLLDVHPKDLQFRLGENGKPRIDETWMGDTDIQFNISHSKQMIVWGIARGVDIGIDTENFTGKEFPPEVVGDVFDAGEIAYLSQIDAARRNQIAYTFWTLKEAFIKATGKGMSFPITQLCFNLISPDRIDFCPSKYDAIHRDDWHFSTYQIDSSEIISLCSKKFRGQVGTRISCFELHSDSSWTQYSLEPIYKSSYVDEVLSG